MTVLTPLIPIGFVVALVLFLPANTVAWFGMAIAVGAFVRIAAHRQRRMPEGRVLDRVEDPDLFAIVDRVCAVADVEPPVIVGRNERQPNSWVVHHPGQSPRLYVTTGLLELLTPTELSAVVAHEISHIANRDALVMSVVGTPGAVMMGARGSFDAIIVWAVGAVSQVGTASLSRYREFAADTGSAMITGRPSALASALLKVSDSLEQLPSRDLRAAAKLNAFNLVAVPARATSNGAATTQPAATPRGRRRAERLLASHPPLQARLDALYALERASQSGRWS